MDFSKNSSGRFLRRFTENKLPESVIELLSQLFSVRNYWDVKGDLTAGIYEAYGKENKEIPFPQMDVHVRSMPK